MLKYIGLCILLVPSANASYHEYDLPKGVIMSEDDINGIQPDDEIFFRGRFGKFRSGVVHSKDETTVRIKSIYRGITRTEDINYAKEPYNLANVDKFNAWNVEVTDYSADDRVDVRFYCPSGVLSTSNEDSPDGYHNFKVEIDSKGFTEWMQAKIIKLKGSQAFVEFSTPNKYVARNVLITTSRFAKRGYHTMKKETVKIRNQVLKLFDLDADEGCSDKIDTMVSNRILKNNGDAMDCNQQKQALEVLHKEFTELRKGWTAEAKDEDKSWDPLSATFNEDVAIKPKVQEKFRLYLDEQTKNINNEKASNRTPLEQLMANPLVSEIHEDRDPINTNEQLIDQFVKLFKERSRKYSQMECSDPPVSEIHEDRDPINTDEQLIARFVKLFKETYKGKAPKYKKLTNFCRRLEVANDLILKTCTDGFQRRLLQHFSTELSEGFLVYFETSRPNQKAKKGDLIDYAKKLGWKKLPFEDNEVDEILRKTEPRINEAFSKIQVGSRVKPTSRAWRKFIAANVGKDCEVACTVTNKGCSQKGVWRCFVKPDKKVGGKEEYRFNLEDVELIAPNKPSHRRLISRLV